VRAAAREDIGVFRLLFSGLGGMVEAGKRSTLPDFFEKLNNLSISVSSADASRDAF
jgi:hypothetical protein